MSYQTSRNYKALYDLLCEGHEALCFVDMSFGDGAVHRDVARVRRWSDWGITVGARGITYGSVDSHHNTGDLSEQATFSAECRRMNLEWAVPHVTMEHAELMKLAQDLFDVVRDHSAGPKFGADHQAAYDRAIAAGFKPSYP